MDPITASWLIDPGPSAQLYNWLTLTIEFNMKDLIRSEIKAHPMKTIHVGMQTSTAIRSLAARLRGGPQELNAREDTKERVRDLSQGVELY